MARLHREAMQVLIDDIVGGEFAPGEWLPGETDVAERFSISRGTAREVIRGLEERGLIEVRHGRGAKVAPRSRWNNFDSEVLAARLESPDRRRLLGDYLEVRRLLEIEAAGMAAERASDEALGAVGTALEKLREAAKASPGPRGEAQFHEADLAFHASIIEATGNAALTELVRRIHDALFAARFPLARPAYRLERAMPEHERIADAIRARDAAAAREAMSAHLDTIASYLDEAATAAA